jgi:hypothetical protein
MRFWGMPLTNPYYSVGSSLLFAGFLTKNVWMAEEIAVSLWENE